MLDVSGGLPDRTTLLALEARARRQGSGLTQEALFGPWRVWRIWSKNGLEPSRASERLLRGLVATLSIQPAQAGQGLLIMNSVQLGALSFCFSGPGQLRQRRPLLFFQFTKLQLLLGKRVMVSFDLPAPAAGKQPFFALIDRQALEGGETWLAARGRGGGLAIWLRPAQANA
jgi:hypothetical protein